MFRELVFLVFVGLTLVDATSNYSETEYDVTGKSVAVTGGARGIGLEIVKKFLEANASKVFILDKLEENGALAAQELNNIYGENRAVFVKCDITTDLKEVSNNLYTNYGPIDVLVNNAGILNEYEPRLVFETNTIATALWTLKFWELMSKENGGNGGTIINIASISGYYVDPFMSMYKSSKAAILGLSKGMGHEYNYKRTGVRVIALCPGFTDTPMTQQQMVRDEQVEIFKKFLAVVDWQDADAVGHGTVSIFKNSKSGVIWSVIGGQEPYVAPDSYIVTADLLDSL